MTTINLQQENQREKMISGAGKLSSNLVFFIVVCVVLVVIFLGLKAGTFYVEKRNDQVESKIIVANESLNEKKSVDSLLDLQTRIKEIKNNLGNKIEANDVLDNLSATVIPGIVFSYYENSGKNVSVTFKSSNFDIISKQVFNFKQADFVTDVNVSKLSRSENGIECSVEMTLK